MKRRLFDNLTDNEFTQYKLTNKNCESKNLVYVG